MRAVVLDLECAMEASQWIGDEDKGVRDAIKLKFKHGDSMADHGEFDQSDVE